jgi:Xaa-Pro dipeptidase
VPHGRPDAEQERVWQTVREAQRRAFDAIRPGATCAEVDRAGRAVIDSAGFGPDYRSFTHRLGHGIGLQGHEDPYFDRGSEVVLAPGMTLSNEPGIYLYGRFGVRIEDIVTVTSDGADHFGAWQAGPLSPAGEGR